MKLFLALSALFALGANGEARAAATSAVSDDDASTALTLSTVTAYPGHQTFAPGNKEQMLLKGVVTTTGTEGTISVSALTLSFASETSDAAADLENLKVYVSGTDYFYHSESKTLLGEVASFTGTSVTIPFTSAYAVSGTTRFYVVADVKENATVGHKIDAVLESLTYGENLTFSAQSNPEGVASIYTYQSTPFMDYQNGCRYWRIPAMVTLKHQKDEAKNGRIVVMADARYDKEDDLPKHIDIVECHSDDYGKTWSAHQTVAGTEADHSLIKSTAGQKGFGDAAIVECADGKLVAIMAAGNGLSASTPENPIEPFIITSEDAGETWSDPVSLYSTVYEHTYTRGTLNATFAGSGRGLLLERGTHKGRIMFAMSHRFDDSTYEEYIIYSDDNGATWNLSSESAYSGGDESKLVELSDGTVMISVRQNGNRGFNRSEDGGDTWGEQYQNAQIPGNGNNADVLYFDKRVLLHTYVNDNSRKQLYITASYDNGKTWSDKFQICEPFAAYSTLDITKDGNIAVLYEDGSWGTNENDRQGYNINYVQLPKSWFVAADPGKAAYETSLATAKEMVAKGGYKHIVLGEAGQCSQASLDALADVVNAEVTDYEAAATALEKAIAAAEATATVTIPGFSNDVYFTISSYANVAANSSKPIYVSSEGKPVDATEAADVQWQFTPNATQGQVNIKQKDAENYLYRTNNTLGASTTKRGWTITPDANGYYYLRAVHSGTSYLVVDLTGTPTSFNFWNNTTGSNQWSTKFVLTPVGKKDVDMTTHTIYHVKFVGAPADAYITYGETEAATNGGVMFLTTDDVTKIKAAAEATNNATTRGVAKAAGDESGVVAHEADGYRTWVSIADNTLTVEYVSAADMQSAIAAAEAVLAKTGVGYPTADNTARATLSTAIETAKAALENLRASDITTLEDAVTTYKSTTTGIQMPEDGKAYTITGVSMAGAKAYMNYADGQYSLVQTTDEDNSNYPVTATLVCRKISEGKYTFVNNDGKYFIWKGTNSGQNSNKGCSDAYNANWVLTVAKMVKGTYATAEQSTYFGYMTMTGLRTNSTQNYFVVKNGTTYDQANAAFYLKNNSGSFSSALLIEETTYPNTAKMTEANGVNGVDYIATFSAPFATILPEGVTAYIVDKTETYANFAEVESGKAIPANTGVLLANTEGGTVTMVPAASEETATITGNLLQHSAGAAHTITADDHAYILAKANGIVAFYRAKVGTTLPMNRAYLPFTAEASTIGLNFGTTNGITPIDASADPAATATYDLSGRRVTTPVKGGLYIRGGKKFIQR